jgi:hypothetical protein
MQSMNPYVTFCRQLHCGCDPLHALASSSVSVSTWSCDGEAGGRLSGFLPVESADADF